MIEEKDIQDEKDSLKKEEVTEQKKSYLKPMGKKHPTRCQMLNNYNYVIFFNGKMNIEEYISKFFSISLRRHDHLVIKKLKLLKQE
jgi:hypothetical protein